MPCFLGKHATILDRTWPPGLPNRQVGVVDAPCCVWDPPMDKYSIVVPTGSPVTNKVALFCPAGPSHHQRLHQPGVPRRGPFYGKARSRYHHCIKSCFEQLCLQQLHALLSATQARACHCPRLLTVGSVTSSPSVVGCIQGSFSFEDLSIWSCIKSVLHVADACCARPLDVTLEQFIASLACRLVCTTSIHHISAITIVDAQAGYGVSSDRLFHPFNVSTKPLL